MESVTTSPSEYRVELETAIARNYKKLVHARTIPNNEEDIQTYEDRLNNRHDGLLDLMGVEHV